MHSIDQKFLFATTLYQLLVSGIFIKMPAFLYRGMKAFKYYPSDWRYRKFIVAIPG